MRVNDLAASKRGIGFVFQNYALFRYMTVYDNIAFGLRVQKADKKKIDERVRELIKLIGLEGLEKRYPSQLSGGQRQRVAFARALAPNPQLLLLDEPFAAIDAKVRKELRSWLREMIEKLGVTSIFVTHDQDQAIEVVVTLPEEKKERIWINKHELIGSFKILPEEVSENDIADESIPDDLREFFELNAGIINERIRIAVEKKNNYAYFSFSNNESDDLKKRIVTKLEQTIDGAMFSLCGNQLEMNVQNLLDD